MRTFLLLSLLAVACTGSPASESPASSSPLPLSSEAGPSALPAVPAQASATAPPSGAPAAPPSASVSASAVAAEGPLPDVEVKNIGMHIGGGPNDNETKAPIKTSVEPHFDTIKRCYAKAEEQKQGDVSLDLKIDKAGGPAEVQKFKSGIPGEAFKDCLTVLFTAIEFKKPKTGTTVVSYSLRFTPGKKK